MILFYKLWKTACDWTENHSQSQQPRDEDSMSICSWISTWKENTQAHTREKNTHNMIKSKVRSLKRKY